MPICSISNQNQNNFVPKMIILAIAACTLLSCSTMRTAPERGSEKIESMMPVPKSAHVASSQQGGATGVLLTSVNVNKVNDGGECRLRLENTSTRKSYFVSLHSDQAVYADVEAGHYQLRRIGCGFSKVWDLSNLLPEGFQIAGGTVGFLGKIIFVFELNEKSGKSELSQVKFASRIENARALDLALEKVPEDQKNSLVSAYTGRPISIAMRNNETQNGFDVLGQGLRSGTAPLQPLLESLKSCATIANKTDPLQLGTLKVVAKYSSRHFVAIEEASGENALSETFVSCVRKSHERFTPTVAGDLKIKTQF
jgi:hypothetical protein